MALLIRKPFILVSYPSFWHHRHIILTIFILFYFAKTIFKFTGQSHWYSDKYVQIVLVNVGADFVSFLLFWLLHTAPFSHS